MNPTLKKEWIKALRSGDYEQGTGRLLQRGADFDHETGESQSYLVGHCCLGVLVEVIGYDIEENPKLYGSNLPNALRIYAGISPDEEVDLMDMNDDLGHDFEDIADWIEVML